MNTHYHNTNGLKGLQLEIAEIKAKSLDEVILKIFHHYKEGRFTPYQIEAILEANGTVTLITSIRRSLTNLTESGCLYKSPKADTAGRFRMPNHTWSLQSYNEEKEAA